MKYLPIFIVIWLYSLFACNGKSGQEPLLPALAQAESLVWDYPDSAFAILNTLQVSVDDDYQYASWCLLYTQAQNGIKITFVSDSLMQIALHYFNSLTDNKCKALTWFYAGQVYADLKRPVDATNAYLKAKELALHTTDYRLLYLIHLNFGWLYLCQEALNEAYHLLNDAYVYAQQTGNAKYCLSALDYIGRYYAFIPQFDSATIYLEKALAIARPLQDPKSMKLILNDIAITYYYQHQYQIAIRYLKESIAISEREGLPTPFESFSNLGDIYLLMGETDSAAYYLHKTLGTDNIYLYQSSYNSLSYLNRITGHQREAVYYTNLFWFYTDSIARVTAHKEIIDLQAQHDQQRLLNINDQLKIGKISLLKKGLISLCIILGIVALLVYFYRRRLLFKERQIQQMIDKLQELNQIYHANEQAIRENNEMIQTIGQRSKQYFTLTEQQVEQVEQLISFQKLNEQLRQQNQQLEQEIMQYTRLLQEKGIEQSTYHKLIEQNLLLLDREKLLLTELLKRMKLTGQLKKNPKYITKEQEQQIMEEINLLYPEFTHRLHNQYTSLTNYEILTCCLIKLRFSTAEIAIMTATETTSVLKRKSRIKDCIRSYQPNAWENGNSLDVFLSHFS